MGIPPAVEVRDLRREYRRGDETVAALRGIDLCVESGERLAIMGPSGCGKSTLLGIVGGLDRPTSGSVMVSGVDLTHSTSKQVTMLRRTSIGYILQSPSLLPMLTAQENVEMPLALNGVDGGSRRQRARELLALMDIEGKAESLPEELSGGQQQRVSVARALAAKPHLILADEPTGNLDSATAEQVLSLLTATVARDGITLIMVTHDEDDARHTDRIVHLKDGLIVGAEHVQ